MTSNTACEAYDESWCPQLACLPCKNGNDYYVTYSDITSFLFGQERIKRVPSLKILYYRSVLRKRTNQKASSLTNVLRRKTNQNAFTKIFTNKKTQIMKHCMRNLQLRLKCRDILTYLNVVGIFWTDLTWRMNKRA